MVVPLVLGRMSRGAVVQRDVQSFLRKSSGQCVQEESHPVLRGEHMGAGAQRREGGKEEGRSASV